MASLTAWLIDITGKKIQMYQYVCYSQASSYMPTFSSIFFRVNPNVATVPLIDELGDLLVFSHRTTKGESPFSHDPCRWSLMTTIIIITRCETTQVIVTCSAPQQQQRRRWRQKETLLLVCCRDCTEEGLSVMFPPCRTEPTKKIRPCMGVIIVVGPCCWNNRWIIYCVSWNANHAAPRQNLNWTNDHSSKHRRHPLSLPTYPLTETPHPPTAVIGVIGNCCRRAFSLLGLIIISGHEKKIPTDPKSNNSPPWGSSSSPQEESSHENIHNTRTSTAFLWSLGFWLFLYLSFWWCLLFLSLAFSWPLRFLVLVEVEVEVEVEVIVATYDQSFAWSFAWRWTSVHIEVVSTPNRQTRVNRNSSKRSIVCYIGSCQ